ncbi:MAG: conjugal transfer protein TraF [Moraxellaceae bacterium]|nr:conjugal transfer protein TraF [Moraxellaceae bacterium]
MRRLLSPLTLAMLGMVPVAAQADIFDARAMGRGGAGLTMGEYNLALINPALINKFDEDDDFSFALNVGVMASDVDGLAEGADEIQNDIDTLFGSFNAARASDINQRMQALNGAMAQVDIGGALMVAIPNNTISAALVVKTKVTLGIAYAYDAGDAAILQGIANAVNTDNDLQSKANTSGIGVAEAGVMLGKAFGPLEIGATLKSQKIELYRYSANVASFDEDDIAEDQNSASHNHINLDVGANFRFGAEGQFVVAGVIENLNPKTFEGPTPNGLQIPAPRADYKMEPVAMAGVGYSGSLVKLEANVDLTPRNGYDQILDTQFARAGIELSAGRHFHLRAGYRTDTKNNVSDVFTAGLGITPFDRFNIDLAGAIGDGDTYGVALQIGFKI